MRLLSLRHFSLARRVLLAGCLLAPGAIYFLVAPASLHAEITIMDEIVCKVNGDIITRSEMDRAHKELEPALRDQGLTGDRLQEAIKEEEPNLLRDKIDNLLLEQKAKEMDFKVDSEVDKQIAAIQSRSKIADPEKFQAFVQEQTGMPYEDYRGTLKSDFLRRRVISEEVSRKIQFKREELQAYYDAHHDEFMRQERVTLREIFVSTIGLNATGQAAAEKKAKDLVSRANKGEKFPDLAQQNSDRAATAQQGGVMPPFTKNGTPGDHMPPDLEAQLWDKDRNYVTDPIKFDDGWEILQIADHQKAGLASFDEVEQEVTNKLFEPRFTPALRGYLNKLRESAFLEIKSPWVDTGAIPNKDTTWIDPAELKPETIKKDEYLNETHHKKLLGLIPIPGTQQSNAGTSSSR
jgi:peptidyl-prolyl cis-trans isomerase SurA